MRIYEHRSLVTTSIVKTLMRCVPILPFGSEGRGCEYHQTVKPPPANRGSYVSKICFRPYPALYRRRRSHISMYIFFALSERTACVMLLGLAFQHFSKNSLCKGSSFLTVNSEPAHTTCFQMLPRFFNNWRRCRNSFVTNWALHLNSMS